jgi:hypothetical protein
MKSIPRPAAVLLVLALAGCGYGADRSASETTMAGSAAGTESAPSVAPVGVPEGWTGYGAGVSGTDVITSRMLLAAAESYNGRSVVVEGQIVDVCQKKGCWMTMLDGDREMRVTFKDYAFFVPLDASGKYARIEGVFEIKDVPADEAKHYLEDAGKYEEAAKITGPVPSYTFLASGVLIKS